MHKKVAVILVNWNSFDLTDACIRSVKQATYKDLDIIVTDNGSADGSGKKLLSTHPDIILLEADKNLGFTGGNNLALKYSLNNGYKYSMLLNNDTEVDPGFLEPLVNFMDNEPTAGALQSRIYFHHDRSKLWNGGSFYNKWAGLAYTTGYNKAGDMHPYNTIRKPDWVTGCAFFTSNDILRRTGILNDQFFIYYEDVDLSFRIRALGLQLFYIPGSIVYHIAGMANKNKLKGKEGFVNPIVHYLNVRNKIWLLKRYTPPYAAPTAIVFNSFYFTALLGYFAARSRFKKLKAVLKGIKDGLVKSL